MRHLVPIAILVIAVIPTPACTHEPAAGPPCPEVAGIDPVLEPGTVLLLGEIHGTREAPGIAAAVACLALEAGLDVVLALEIPADENDRAQRYLVSTGSEEDRRALLEGSFWGRANQDGRSSRAVAELLERARVLRGETDRLEVALFDRDAEEDAQARDRTKARALEGLATSAPDAIVVVLTGNVHARVGLGTPWDPEFEPMGFLLRRALPRREIVALNLEHAGGEAWVCTGSAPSDCGPRSMRGSGTTRDVPSVRFDDSGDPFHGVYSVGSLTSSPPARPERGSPISAER